jgi:lipid-binding SYLF domain-containing protein
LLVATVLTGLVLAGVPQPVSAVQEADTIIDQAVSTWQNYMQDPDFPGFRAHVKEAKGVLIIPKLLKGAFLFGIEGGNGVLLVRDEKTGAWSEPVFYEMSSASFGLQAGGQQMETVVVVQTVKGIESLLTSTVKFSAEASAAIGPKGGGMAGSANLGKDYVSYARGKGVFAGVSVEGASVRTRDDLNKVYYGTAVRPSDLVLLRNVKPNPHSQALVEAVTAGTKGN